MSKNVIAILSEKSSGSTILIRTLCNHSDLNHVRFTQHKEHETLFWLRAAHILGFDESDRLDLGYAKLTDQDCRRDMIELVSGNDGTAPAPDAPAEEFVDACWQQLSTSLGPVFVEKSPHHLHSRPAMQAMMDCTARLGQKLTVVFLVRDPLDMLSSAWNRWKSDPVKREQAWVRAHGNVLWLRERLPADHHVTVRYEDFVAEPQKCCNDILAHVDRTANAEMVAAVHTKSVGKSKKTPLSRGNILSLFAKKVPFREVYSPSPELSEMAPKFGYSLDIPDA